MRVIAGSARGRRLQCLKGRLVRPTGDRVKEAVFSSLAPRLPGSRVLDLFAGSGALGIEALSRGAVSAVFVELSQPACELIVRNLDACGWQPSAEVRVIRADALRWLQGAAEQDKAFDVILADPPYRMGLDTDVLDLVSTSGRLAPDGMLVLESSARQELPECSGVLRLVKNKVYGDTKISYYCNDSQAEEPERKGV